VQPPQFVARTDAKRVEVIRSLRVLYCDFIAGGGLEELRRCRDRGGDR
jgi:hypothetical protein